MYSYYNMIEIEIHSTKYSVGTYLTVMRFHNHSLQNKKFLKKCSLVVIKLYYNVLAGSFNVNFNNFE